MGRSGLCDLTGSLLALSSCFFVLVSLPCLNIGSAYAVKKENTNVTDFQMMSFSHFIMFKGNIHFQGR